MKKTFSNQLLIVILTTQLTFCRTSDQGVFKAPSRSGSSSVEEVAQQKPELFENIKKVVFVSAVSNSLDLAETKSEQDSQEEKKVWTITGVTAGGVLAAGIIGLAAVAFFKGRTTTKTSFTDGGKPPIGKGGLDGQPPIGGLRRRTGVGIESGPTVRLRPSAATGAATTAVPLELPPTIAVASKPPIVGTSVIWTLKTVEEIPAEVRDVTSVGRVSFVTADPIVVTRHLDPAEFEYSSYPIARKNLDEAQSAALKQTLETENLENLQVVVVSRKIPEHKLDIPPEIKPLPRAKMTGGSDESVIGVAPPGLMGTKVHAFSKQGSRYPAIEDRWTVETGPSGIKYNAVYDGHAGPQVSELLNKEFHLFLDQHRARWENDPRQIANLFVEFDQLALKQGGKLEGENAGSTATMMIEIPGKPDLILVNLGDSPAVVVKKNGEVMRSRDHEPTDPDEGKIIAKKGGEVFAGRVDAELAVARAFGDAKLKSHMTVEPDIYTIPRNDVSFVVLMSDGVGEAWPRGNKASVEGVAQHINDLLITRKDPNSNVAETFYEGLTYKGTDDITMVVVPVGS